MKPYLRVNGTLYPIEHIEYSEGIPMMVMIKTNDKREFFYNSALDLLNEKHPNIVDFEKAIYWNGRYDPIYKEMKELRNALKELFLDGE